MTTLYSKTLTDNSPGWQGYSLRQKIGATGVASEGQIRVKFTASTAASMTVDHASVALVGGATFPNVSATPTELLFSGASGFTVAAGATITSDWLTFAALGTDEIAVIMDFNSGVASAARSAADATANYQFKASSASYNSASVSGYTDAGGSTYIALIETQVGVTTVALTGIAATASRGSVTGRATRALAGESLTASKGAPTVLFSKALSGHSATASRGSVTGRLSLVPTGIAASGAIGSLGKIRSSALSGQAATATLTSVTAVPPPWAADASTSTSWSNASAPVTNWTNDATVSTTWTEQ